MSQFKFKTGLTAVIVALLLMALGWSFWANIQAAKEASSPPVSSFKNAPQSGATGATSPNSTRNATHSIDSDNVLTATSAPAAIVDKMTDKTLVKDHTAYDRDLAIAFILYAKGNQGNLPSDISAVSDKLGDDAKNYPFKILYRGSLDKVKKPAQTVMLREDSFMLSDGQLARSYVFADGHVELATSATGDFSSWESDHAPTLVSP